MLWTIAIIFALLWALGLVTAYTMGGYIHVLIVVAVVLLLAQIIKGTRHLRSYMKPRHYKRRTR